TRKLLHSGDIRYEYDHQNPSYFSGDASLDNCQVLCRSCHSDKTSQRDRPAISKSRRISRRARGIRKRRVFRRWRAFDGTIRQARDGAADPHALWRGPPSNELSRSVNSRCTRSKRFSIACNEALTDANSFVCTACTVTIRASSRNSFSIVINRPPNVPSLSPRSELVFFWA